MEFYVYILYSKTHDKTYVGYTNNLTDRLIFHNTSENKRAYTFDFRPWTIIYFEEFSEKSEALLREKWFKTGVGRELKSKILSEFLLENP